MEKGCKTSTMGEKWLISYREYSKGRNLIGKVLTWVDMSEEFSSKALDEESSLVHYSVNDKKW